MSQRIKRSTPDDDNLQNIEAKDKNNPIIVKHGRSKSV